MNKKDVQDLYEKIKRRPSGQSSAPSKSKAGCKSCGKVKWKPNR